LTDCIFIVAYYRDTTEMTYISVYTHTQTHTQSVAGGKVNILGGHSIGHSKQKCLYEHVSYSERLPR